MKTTFVCADCDTNFTRKNNLERHKSQSCKHGRRRCDIPIFKGSGFNADSLNSLLTQSPESDIDTTDVVDDDAMGEEEEQELSEEEQLNKLIKSTVEYVIEHDN